MQLARLAASLTAIAALSAAALVYSSHPVRGSDHQDSPGMVSQPPGDITDVYVFPSPTNSNAVDLVMDVFPLIPAGMSGNKFFDPRVLYQFKIAHGPLGTTAPEDTVIQVLPRAFGGSQSLMLYGPQTPPMVGTKSVVGTPTGSFPLNKPIGTTFSNGITAFAGPRADPFFFDLFQFFSILPDRYYANPRSGDKLGSSTPTFNGFASGSTSGPGAGNYACSTTPSTNALTQVNGGFNVLSIVLEVPKAMLVSGSQSSIIHVWATTSWASPPNKGVVVYKQRELLARPAVKELFEPFVDHAKTNVVNPYNDPFISADIPYFMTNVAGRSAATTNVVSSVLYPNELAADLSQSGPAAYLGVETGGATGSKFGGRGLTDDIITPSLGVVFGNTVSALGLAPDDGKENDCLISQHVASGQGGRQTQQRYPYLARPH